MKENRRPLASRDTNWARSLTRWLAATSITPNQISIASMAMAALAGAAFWTAGGADGVLRVIVLILAALFCQLRLLCNLLDGMVAIEAGKNAADGPFWNEFPDRVSDIVIVTRLGYGVGHPALGWAAAGFCVLTAYVRELGGRPVRGGFFGAHGKAAPALITAAALVSCFDPLWNGQDRLLVVALWLVALGAAVTVLRRSMILASNICAPQSGSYG